MPGDRLSGRAGALILREVEAGRIPFGAFGVWLGGEQVCAAFEGYADMEERRAAGPDTLLRLYSMTKPVTAIAAMILCDRGQLTESDPVSKYLPEYAFMKALDARGIEIGCERELTVADLLNMTAGMVYPGPDEVGTRIQAMFDAQHEAISKGQGYSTREVARQIALRPLQFQPGAHWRYGLEADVLGAVIEVVSGKTLGDFLREELFQPLGMRDTGFFVPSIKQYRFAQLYKREAGRLMIDQVRHLGLTECLAPPAYEAGGAGLISSFDDYGRFGRMLAGYGQLDGVRILREGTVRSFETDQLTDAQHKTLAFASSQGYGYGHLMRVCVDPRITTSPADTGEFGWDGWTGVYMAVNARRNLFLLYLTQVSEGIDPRLMEKLRTLVCEMLP
jgi:CubicO group peptidase (beta-lactamase class C family)